MKPAPKKARKSFSRPPVPSHSTLPFENLRVLSPSAVSSGPNGIVEGLMALSEAPRASARGICGGAKRNCAEATRLRPTGYAAVACRHSSPRCRTGHPGEGE